VRTCRSSGGGDEYLGFADGEFDRGYRVVLVRGGRDVPAELVLRPVVPAAREPPGPARGGLELREVQLPDLIRAGGLRREGGFAAGGELPAFALVVGLKQQAFVAQQPQHGGV
jgi:hypothetical protein